MSKKGIELDISSFQMDVLKTILGKSESGQKSERKVRVEFADPYFVGTTGITLTKEEQVAHDKAVSDEDPLVKSVLNVLNGPGDSIERLAFETNPSQRNSYQSLYKRKLRLLPDEILKRIAIQDDLVAAIVNTRSNQVAAFGRPQPDRFSTGFKIETEPGYLEKLSTEEKKALQAKISRAEARMLTCGSTSGWKDVEALSLSQFLFMSARNAVVFGRAATEVIWIDSPAGRKFHSFRPIDAGTIFRAQPQKEAAQSVRESALRMLSDLKNKSLKPERYVADEYAWVQVIDGQPRQAFSGEECIVHSFYPTTDVELDGYPVTPLDTVIAAVTMHINITTHNKLYFQSGRASRGMVVIKSDDIDDRIVGHIRQQFNASINSVGNSFRMPIFGVGSEDDVSWYPIDNSSRDMEFQYLSDTNARVILSAFQMSPEEIPGYSHLSRGTNSQALSESNTEYKLEAHRDVGIRPLLAQFQNFINAKILPLVDEELAQFCHFKFIGLDAETAEKESVRLQQDMAVHMSMDNILERVEKKAIGKRWGGEFNLNPQWQAVLDKFVMVGDQMEYFLGIEGAAKDPRFQYLRDPFFFQFQQLQQQAEALKAQAQQPPPDAGGPPGDGGPDKGKDAGDKKDGEDLSSSAAQLQGMLKSEQQLPSSKRRLLAHQRQVIQATLAGLEADAQKATDEVLKTVEQFMPTKLKG